jgi:hypothetical protein
MGALHDDGGWMYCLNVLLIVFQPCCPLQTDKAVNQLLDLLGGFINDGLLKSEELTAGLATFTEGLGDLA